MYISIREGDCIERMREIEDCCVDSVVTDPPYGLGFMGKKWDALPPGVDVFRECLRILKPGGHILAFGGSRTYHRLAVAVEDAGFEIRDQIMWLYGSGFPKSQNVSKAIDKAAGVERTEVRGVKPGYEGFAGRGTSGVARDKGSHSGEGGFHRPWMEDQEKANAYHLDMAPETAAAKQWDGWGTALKPAHEPIVVARKPLEGTVANNVTTHGVGALNIDGCRNGTTGARNNGRKKDSDIYGDFGSCERVDYNKGRWPANLILTYPEDEYALRDEVTADQLSKLAEWMNENAKH